MKQARSGTGSTALTGLEIAVTGMAGRFPGAVDIETFWENLRDGVESISFFADRELSEDGVEPALLKNPHYVKAYGILEDIEYFDAAFFGYSPNEAAVMDPQMRIFHQCAWNALEDAACCPDTYEGLIGLYAGATASFGWIAAVQLSGRADAIGQYAAAQLMNKDFLSLRLSYKLNLKGPAVAVQSTCSTSLLAIHLACQALLNGECDLALAGGVTVTLLDRSGYVYQPGMIRSPDGHCRAFDARAGGTIGGNGAAVVVLKRLTEAVDQGDHIYAVVKSSAANNDGVRKVGFTAPSIEGEAEVIMTALEMAEVEPRSVTYVETHGTATDMGDPVEMEALKLAFNTDQKEFCAVGSLKTNVGHVDSAAGAAGFIKAVLALRYRLIPPSLHFEEANPKIDFADSPFYVNTGLKEWTNNGGPLRAGVSSFGIGGTNVHVILEEAPAVAPGRVSAPPAESQLILLSAKTDSALERASGNLTDHFRNHPAINLADAAYTLQTGRKAFGLRKMLVCSSLDEAADALTSPGAANVYSAAASEGEQGPPAVFMFSGQGAQYVDMGRGLYRLHPLFRQEMDGCFSILTSFCGTPFKEILYPDGSPAADINQTEVAQPLLFCVEYALAKLLLNWGIKADAMIGHSIGEYVAACLAGVFSLEDALKVVALRGKLMQQLPAGAMLSVSLPEAELLPLLASNRQVSLAAVNSTCLCTVSGSPQAVEKLAEELTAKGHQVSRLHTSHAFHSPMMEPILAEFETKVGQLRLSPPTVPFISNLTGKWILPEEAIDPAYWRAHLRQTVRFADGLGELLKGEEAVLIEIGPGNVLSTLARKHRDKKAGHFTVNLIRHPRQEDISDDRCLITQIGKLWLHRVDIDWQQFHGHQGRRRIPLPGYPFDRHAFPVKTDLSKINLRGGGQNFLASGKNDLDKWFYVPQWLRSVPAHHRPRIPVDSPWLLFVDKPGSRQFSDRLVGSLESEKVEPILVRPARDFERLKANAYTLDPAQESHYGQLFRALQADGVIPARIVYLWHLAARPDQLLTVEDFDVVQERGFYSLLRLVQAAAPLTPHHPLSIDVVTNNMQEVTGGDGRRPHLATLLAALQVIPQEQAHIRCRSIDIELPPTGSPAEGRLVETLTQELLTESAHPLVAYRGDFRWEKVFLPLEAAQPEKEALPFREGGVYLITGGLGHIGLALAGYLARNYRARLVLTGRRIRQVQELEDLGAEVLVLAADVGDEAEMKATIDRAEQHFGVLNGVVHGAGIVGSQIFRPVRELSAADCRQQFRAKAYGLLVLEKVLRDKEIDFCLLMSSVSSVLGGLGFAAYSAANIFMDAFTVHHNRQNRQRWLSVNWDGWQFAEIQEDSTSPSAARTEFSMLPDEGVRAFTYVLSWPYFDQVVVSTGDLDERIRRWIKRERPPLEAHAPQSHQRPDLSTKYIEPEDEVEQTLAGLFQNFLGIERVGIDDNFFELGLSSLDLVQISGRLTDMLKQEIAVVAMFSYPTVRTLARHIKGENSPPVTAAVEAVQGQEAQPADDLLQNAIDLLKEN